MGLQIGELEDITYDSIPILLLTIIAAAIRSLRASVFNFINQLKGAELIDSGHSTLISIAEQLNLINIIALCSNSIDELNGYSDDIDCVVCLCEMSKRQRLRKLECGHVFHKKCLDGWLNQLHFTCPLCRSPVPNVTNSKSKMECSNSSWFGIR